MTVIGTFPPHPARGAIATAVATVAGVRGVLLEDADIPVGRAFEMSLTRHVSG